MDIRDAVDKYNDALDVYYMDNLPHKKELIHLIELCKVRLYDILNEKSGVEVFSKTGKQKFELKAIMQNNNYI